MSSATPPSGPDSVMQAHATRPDGGEAVNLPDGWRRGRARASAALSHGKQPGWREPGGHTVRRGLLRGAVPIACGPLAEAQTVAHIDDSIRGGDPGRPGPALRPDRGAEFAGGIDAARADRENPLSAVETRAMP